MTTTLVGTYVHLPKKDLAWYDETANSTFGYPVTLAADKAATFGIP